MKTKGNSHGRKPGIGRMRRPKAPSLSTTREDLSKKPPAKAVQHAAFRKHPPKAPAAGGPVPKNPMDREVPVRLGAEALKIRENELAEKFLLRERLQQELADYNKARRGEINALSERLHKLAEILSAGEENKKQRDLRFGEAAGEAAAADKATLGQVAKTVEDKAAAPAPAAGGGTELAAEKKADTQGAGGEGEKKPPLPSEPHAYVDEAGKCAVCESGPEDPIHSLTPGGQAPAVDPHKFAGTGGAAGACGKCGAVEGDPVHDFKETPKRRKKDKAEAPAEVQP